MTQPSLLARSSDYYGSGPGMHLLRLGFAASQRLWPALAVGSAQRLFGTPMPPKWLQRSAVWAPDWRVESWPFEHASLGIYTRPFAPHGPAVLLVHGWGGHAGQLRAVADALVLLGLRPVIVEMPAHGRSAGQLSNLPQFARAIGYVAARLQQHGHALGAAVGHSLGANALAYAAAHGLPVQRLVLLAPPASPHVFTQLFAQVFGLSENTRAAMQQRIEAREAILMRQFEPAAVGPRIQQQTLVVHDRGDRTNRFADGAAFAQAIGNARLLATEGLGHRRLLKDAPVLDAVAAFLAPLAA